MFGHRPPRSTSPPPIRRAEEAADGITPPEGSPGLLRSQLTPSYLGDRSKRSGRASQRDKCNEGRREVRWAVTILNSMADGQAQPLNFLVPGTSPPVVQGSQYFSRTYLAPTQNLATYKTPLPRLNQTHLFPFLHLSPPSNHHLQTSICHLSFIKDVSFSPLTQLPTPISSIIHHVHPTSQLHASPHLPHKPAT